MFMSTDDINKMFQMMEDYNLDLAQPSISLDGMNYVHMFSHDSQYILRYTNYVECCAMLLSKRGLDKVKRTFSETVTGWGWDALVSDMILEKKNVAVLDSVQAYHGMSMSSINKVLPRERHRVEGKQLLKKYDKLKVLERREVLSGIDLDGKHLDITFYTPEAKTQYTVKVHLGDKITWEPALIQRK